MSDKVLNEFEIQKIENIFRNSHLYTKNKIEITYTNVDNGSYPHINYDLIIDKKIHINLYASKNTYENEDEYLKKYAHYDMDDYPDFPDVVIDSSDDLYPLNVLEIKSSVYVEKSTNKKLHLEEYSKSFWELFECEFYLDYKNTSHMGFFGRNYERSNEWKKKTISNFDKKGKKFLKDTFSKIEKLKKTVKFGNPKN